MAKFSGVIGFKTALVEVRPDVYKEIKEEKKVYGDLIKNIKQSTDVNEINGGMNLSVKVSFVADPYTRLNFADIQYIKLSRDKTAKKWRVKSADITQPPRIILEIGGLYNDD